MRNKSFAFTLIALLLPGPMALWAQQPENPARSNPAGSNSARSNIEQIVREYILQHPEVLVESARLYQERERTAQNERSKAAISARLEDLQHDPSSPSAGAPGSITIVEFFDYRCGFCRKAEAAVTQLIAHHPDVQFVYKEFPILGPESIVAAKAALAAAKQGMYVKFHTALMSFQGPITADSIEKLAAQLGLDIPRLKADMESPDIQSILERNRDLGHDVGVNATPTFFVGSEIAPGAIDVTAFEKLIAQAKHHSIEPAELNTRRDEARPSGPGQATAGLIP